MSTELQTTNRAGAITLVKEQMDMIHQLQRAVMTKGEDYGVIPGTGSKPTLLKPGAEKLCVLFRLSTKVQQTIRELGGDHREYETKVTLHRRDEEGEFFGEGVGTCSTLESKYRYRNASRKCPVCGKEAIIKGKAEYGGGFVCFNKKGGCGAKFSDGDPAISGQAVGRIDNPDVADSWNTVMKMAKKRALVDAVLTATAASQCFTQDLEDIHQTEEVEPAPQQAPPPKADPAFLTPAQWRKVQDVTQRTPNAKLAQQTILARFKVKRPGEIPATMFDHAMQLAQSMVEGPPLDRLAVICKECLTDDALAQIVNETFDTDHGDPRKLSEEGVETLIKKLATMGVPVPAE